MMAALFFVSMLAVMAVEYCIYLPLVRESQSLLLVLQKAARTLSSRHISDHWKERVLVAYARSIVGSTCYLVVMIVGLLILMLIGALSLDWLFDPQPPISRLILTPKAWVWMTVSSFIYLVLRKRLVKR